MAKERGLRVKCHPADGIFQTTRACISYTRREASSLQCMILRFLIGTQQIFQGPAV